MMTAEEVLKEGNEGFPLNIVLENLEPEQIVDSMIEFAKLHVEACKKEMREKFADQIGGRDGYGNEIIMGVYPLENIK